MSERMYGADIDQLRTLAALFDDRSQALSTAVDLVGGSVSQVQWFGPSSEMFRDEWDSAHAPALRDAATALTATAGRLRDNADAQEATSADLGAPGGGPGPSPGPSPSPGPGPVPPPGPPGTDPGDTSDGDSWADRLNGLVGELGWWGSAGTVAEFAAELLYRGGTGLWSLADDIPGVFGAAGQALGWLGVATGGWTMGQGIAEGDWWKVGDGAITAGLGLGAVLAGAALVSNPVGWAILGAGAAWAVADIFIDGNITETVWNGASDAAQWAWDAGGDLVDGAGDLAEDVWDAGGDLLDGAGDLAEDLWPF